MFVFQLKNSHVIKKCFLNSLHVKKCSTKTQKTALYDFHRRNGAKMTDFGGFSLPLYYANMSTMDSHMHTRRFASVFDVSHMQQIIISGLNASKFMESICPSDCEQMKIGQACYTLILNDKTAGIVDDSILIRIGSESFKIISNASRRIPIRSFLQTKIEKFQDVNIEFLNASERSLLAVQGPLASNCLQKLVNCDLSQIGFMHSKEAIIEGGIDCHIARCGYTGEDGFEIALPATESERFVTTLLEMSGKNVMRMAGLGARDSLRLEAGLCLYGNEIDEQKNPVEASLAWVISKRRHKLQNYPGCQIVVEALASGTTKRRIGLVFTEKAPVARNGYYVFNNYSDPIGFVTSGSFSPVRETTIAMAYVRSDLTRINTPLSVKIRDRHFACRVHKLPFIKTNYYSLKN